MQFRYIPHSENQHLVNLQVNLAIIIIINQLEILLNSHFSWLNLRMIQLNRKAGHLTLYKWAVFKIPLSFHLILVG